MSIEAKQVYEWVKTRHWSLRQFKEWLEIQREPLTDAPLYLSNLVNALDNAFISSWQSTADWSKELNEARDYLAAHGIKDNT